MKTELLITYMIIFLLSNIIVEKEILPKFLINKKLTKTIFMGIGIMVIGITLGIILKLTVITVSLTIFASTLIAWKLRNGVDKLEKGVKI